MAQNEGRFSQYDRMTCEELEGILQKDGENFTDQQLSAEEALYIAKLLADRGRCPISTEDALKTFREYYLPEGAGRRKRALWHRRAASAAAVLTLTVTAFAATHAMGLDLWGRLVSWNEDTFHYIEPEKPAEFPLRQDDRRSFDSLREVMRMKNLPAEILPQWIPERFQMEEVRLLDNPTTVSAIGRYAGDGQSLTIRAVRNLNGQTVYVEKDGGSVEVYESHGRDCYIFTNEGRLQGVWSLGDCECYVSGNVTIEEMKKIMDSVL